MPPPDPEQNEAVTEDESLVLAFMSILFERVYSNLHMFSRTALFIKMFMCNVSSAVSFNPFLFFASLLLIFRSSLKRRFHRTSLIIANKNTRHLESTRLKNMFCSSQPFHILKVNDLAKTIYHGVVLIPFESCVSLCLGLLTREKISGVRKVLFKTFE